MIRITVQRKLNQAIDSFSVEGHANYTHRGGGDIVCAGVSSVSMGMVNAIEVLTGVQLTCNIKDGFLSGHVPHIEQPDVEAKVQLLLESMIVSLQTIETAYDSYIQIEDTQLSREVDDNVETKSSVVRIQKRGGLYKERS